MSEASYPADLLYHPEHDWARVEDGQATLGITWYAQDALGEVVFFQAPSVGETLAKDAPYAEVESVKAVSDVVAPLSGEITEVNQALTDNPQMINEDPYGEGWLVKVRLADPSERDALMDAEAYSAGLGGEAQILESLHRHHPRGSGRDARRDRRGLCAGDLRPPDPRGRAPGPGT